MIPVDLLVLFIIVLTILFVIAGVVEEKIKQKRNEKDRLEIERVLNENYKALSVRPQKPPLKAIMHGYDSPEVFQADTVIRIRRLETAKHADAEKKN